MVYNVKRKIQNTLTYSGIGAYFSRDPNFVFSLVFCEKCNLEIIHVATPINWRNDGFAKNCIAKLILLEFAKFESLEIMPYTVMC